MNSVFVVSELDFTRNHDLSIQRHSPLNKRLIEPHNLGPIPIVIGSLLGGATIYNSLLTIKSSPTYAPTGLPYESPLLPFSLPIVNLVTEDVADPEIMPSLEELSSLSVQPDHSARIFPLKSPCESVRIDLLMEGVSFVICLVMAGKKSSAT